MSAPAASTNSLIDVLDRILDKGVLVDAWARIPLVGIDIVATDSLTAVSDRSVRLTHDSLNVFLQNCPHASPRTKRRFDDDTPDEDEGTAARPVALLPRKPTPSGSVAATPTETDENSDVENTGHRPRPSKPSSDLDWLDLNEQL